MKNLIKTGALVSWKSGGKSFFGNVLSIDEDSALIQMKSKNHWGEERSVPVAKLKYEPPAVLSADALRSFSRFEISFTELMQNRVFAEIEIPETYQITPTDLKTAVENYQKKGISEEDFGAEYFWPLWDVIYNGVGIETALNGPDDRQEKSWIPDQHTVFTHAWNVFLDVFEYGEEDVSLNDVITEVQIWLDNKDKPVADRDFSKEQKRDVLHYWNDKRLESANPETKSIYRKVLDSLCAENDIGALKTKAYACYGKGNAAYGQDWQASMECLLKLMELEPDPQTANTLGYMYYYGRCTNGVPEYDKAFYYFSIGAAGWYYESRYKLADMYLHGYGVAKNPKVVSAIIWELYEEQLKKIRKGEFTSNFADVAFRAGNLWKEGINCYRSADHAFSFYLQARYAIRMRMLAEDNYGDQKVAVGIERAIAEILPETGYSKPIGTVHMNSLYHLLQYGLGKKHHMEMKVRRVSETEAKLTFRIVPYENEDFRRRIFVTVPQLHFCGLVEKVVVAAKHICTLELYGEEDTVLFDSIDGNEFFFYGRKVAEISADLIYKKPVSKGKKHRFVSVTFTPGGKRYDYLCDAAVSPGDHAVVLTSNGETVVTIEAVFEKAESELAIPLKQYKRILRKT